MRRRKAGGKTTHDYSKPARPVVENEEVEEVVVPKERVLPYYISYRLPEDGTAPVEGAPGYDNSIPVRPHERVEAKSKNDAERIFKSTHPTAIYVYATQATLVLVWRPAGSKEPWESVVDTGGGQRTYEKEVDLLNWIHEDFKAKPALLGRGFDMVPEFEIREFDGRVPEELA